MMITVIIIIIIIIIWKSSYDVNNNELSLGITLALINFRDEPSSP
jgi:hypothetical protein